MSKGRKLNTLDLMIHKRDFLWGKEYYGWFAKGKLINSILFSKYYGTKNVFELYKLEENNSTMLKSFLSNYSKKIRYFIRELDEQYQIEDIQFMQEHGFRRISRNHCFEFNNGNGSTNTDLESQAQFGIICRDAVKADVEDIYSIDQSAQILDYRDCLFKSKRFIKDNLDNIYVFADIHDTSKIYAYAIKKGSNEEHCFQFIVNNTMTEMIPSFINAFKERYVHFEKHPLFRFVISETHCNLINKLREKFESISSTQILILEGAPREKNKRLARAYVPRPAAAG